MNKTITVKNEFLDDKIQNQLIELKPFDGKALIAKKLNITFHDAEIVYKKWRYDFCTNIMFKNPMGRGGSKYGTRKNPRKDRNKPKG